MNQPKEAPAANWMVWYTALAFGVQIVAVLLYQRFW